MDRKVKNDELFKRIDTKKLLWNTVRSRRKAWIRHIISNSPWITVMKGKIEGKPGRGRPRISFLKQVMEDTGIETYGG